jgi:hypothetical protein
MLAPFPARDRLAITREPGMAPRAANALLDPDNVGHRTNGHAPWFVPIYQSTISVGRKRADPKFLQGRTSPCLSVRVTVELSVAGA